MANTNLVTMKKRNIMDMLFSNIVPILFGIIIVLGLFVTGESPILILNDIVQYSFRNAFLVLSLLIPILAGMGLNFSIVIGAMAGQIGVIMAVNWGMSGFSGFLAAVAFATPFAILFGFLVGKLLNKAHGHEMIASIFVGYFANGVYQIICLSLVGGLIPIDSSQMLLSSGIGLRNTIDLKGTLGSSVDGVFGGALQVPIFSFLIVCGMILLAYNIYRLKNRESKQDRYKITYTVIMTAVITIVSALIMYTNALPIELTLLKNIKFSLMTGLLIGALVVFNLMFPRTKIGRQMQNLGHDHDSAEISGVPVAKARIMAIMISIILASWGQIIFLQNTGVLITYGSHIQVGMLPIVALLIGGASIKKATVGQALLGVVLLQGFHVIWPSFFNALIGVENMNEPYRVIILNGVFLYAFVQVRSNGRVKSEINNAE